MNVVYIVPGSGNTFYCQNCFRDVLMVQGLRRLGHDVIMVPMYLPLFKDADAAVTSVPVFYGAVSLYLKHRLPALRRLPRSILRWLDAPPLLALAAQKAGSTRASGLEDLTLSMLAGEQGRQAEELNRLADWLGTQARPDVVHLSNALLLGLADPLKRRFGVPIVCSLQDEDTWIDAMAPAATARLWQVLIGKSAAVDRFVAVSRYYAEVMQERLRIPPARMQVVPAGIDMEGHTAAPLATDPPVIGYLSRLAESEGFGLLVEAFMRLKAMPQWRSLKLRATGGQTADNAAFIRKHQRALAARGWEADLDLLPAFDKPARLAFLQSLTILSVPALKGEAFGTYLIEAMASGVPVVQPRLGAFPEIVESTGGGILYAPNTADALAAALESLLRDPAQARALGQRGQAAVRATYDIRLVAEGLAEIYRQCTRA